MSERNSAAEAAADTNEWLYSFARSIRDQAIAEYKVAEVRKMLKLAIEWEIDLAHMRRPAKASKAGLQT